MTDPTKKPPAELARLQRGFGKSISTPLRFVDDAGNYEIQYDRYDAHAVDRIEPRGAKSGAERLAVYNQQYWFRLLTIMQEEFPLTEALMGIQDFNRLSMAYIDACPPDSPRLRDLSNRFAEFVRTRELADHIVEAVDLERIYVESFDAASLPVPSTDDPETAARLATEPLRFQPHLEIFAARMNVVELRRRVKRGETVAMDELVESPATWALWRGNGIQAVELGPLQAQLLRRLVAGEPLVDACDALAATLDEAQLEFLGANVQRWFAAWGAAKWFATPADL